MPPPAVPSEEVSDAYIANLQPACSSSSSGITCMNIELDSDDADADDVESVDKEMQASDAMATVWTDSKHSSYLDFMEQSFVRDLYEREYCALDVCGQPSQGRHHHHHQHAEEAHDADSAELGFPTPFEPMEFKVWENGNWTWRVDSKWKVHRWTLLSNPWVKHFRTRASCGNDMSNTTLPKNGPKNGQGETQISCSLDLNIPDGNPGATRGKEVGGFFGGEGVNNAPEAKHCIQQLFVHEDSKSRKRTAQLDRQLESDQATSRRSRAHFWLDEGNMKLGVLGEVCKRSDQEDKPCGVVVMAD